VGSVVIQLYAGECTPSVTSPGLNCAMTLECIDCETIKFVILYF